VKEIGKKKKKKNSPLGKNVSSNKIVHYGHSVR